MAKKALGKGLGALIRSQRVTNNDDDVDNSSNGSNNANNANGNSNGDIYKEFVIEESIEKIIPSSFQPRKNFNDENISELKDSIKQHGIIQPIITRKRENGFEIIAGERRLRAAKELNLTKVPIIIKEAEDKDVLEMMLIENLQREDLNPIEEANAFAKLMEEFKMTQQGIAEKIGRSRASIANTTRLLDLETKVQKMLEEGQLSVGHAKVLLSIKDLGMQVAAAEEIINKKLTVRETESLVASYTARNQTEETADNSKDKTSEEDLIFSSSINKIQEKLSNLFATNVKIVHGKDKGKLVIDYYSQEDLDRLLEVMGISNED